MASMGVYVERPIVPTSIQLATDESVLKDPQSYAVTVSSISSGRRLVLQG